MNDDVLESRGILGEGHTDTLKAMNTVAMMYRDQGKTGEAVEIPGEVVKKCREMIKVRESSAQKDYVSWPTRSVPHYNNKRNNSGTSGIA